MKEEWDFELMHYRQSIRQIEEGIKASDPDTAGLIQSLREYVEEHMMLELYYYLKRIGEHPIEAIDNLEDRLG